MQLSKHRREPTARINMTPMIDVTFLLLIFFMTVTQVSEVNKERVELPKQKGAEDQTPVELIINVTQEGDVYVSGERISLARLASLLGEQIADVGGDPNRVRVVLRADERGESRTVNEVVETLDKLLLKRVRIAVQVPQ
jgi:biopolymer transport protein ExbD